MNLKEIFFDYFGLFLEKKTEQKKIKDTLKKILPYEVGYDLIRLGEESDGGYLIPNDIKNIKYCYSAGVGFVTKFEKDLYNIYNIKSILIDPGNIPQEILPKEAKIIKKYLSVLNSKDSISINEFIDTEEEIILKIDIEGDEYLNLINIDEDKLSRVRVLIIEFHDLRNLRSNFFFNIFDIVINKLSKFFYFCHLHPNNTSKIKKIGKVQIPDMLEITLINKKRVKITPKKKLKITHELDRKTDPKRKDLFFDEKKLFQ